MPRYEVIPIQTSMSMSMLAGAIRRLHKVSLSYNRLTTEQSTEIVKAIISSTTLVDVGLGEIDLRSIQADMLAGAIRRLHKVSLSYNRRALCRKFW